MRLLYLSCHSILEYDELRMFNDIEGLEVFSPGAYLEGKGDGMRPELPVSHREEWLDAWSRVKPDNSLEGVSGDQKAHLTSELLSLFDAVMIMHIPDWLSMNWDVLRDAMGKHDLQVYWRDIGQSQPHQEHALKAFRKRGVQLIRYSERTAELPNYAGSDALIPFGKYPEDFETWSGQLNQVITFGQSMKARNSACRYDLFEANTKGFKRKVFGPGNDGLGRLSGGKLTHSEQLTQLQLNRAYFFTGTFPAPYTLGGIEAMMAGIPIVSITPADAGYNTFDIPRMLTQCGLASWVCRDGHFKPVLETLLGNDPQVFQPESDRLKAYAKMAFGKDFVIAKWKEFFGV